MTCLKRAYGSGFESLSGRAGGVWKSVNLEILEFRTFGIRLEKQDFRTSWDMTGQRLQILGLKLQSFILTFQVTDRYLCQTIIRAAGWVHLKCLSFPGPENTWALFKFYVLHDFQTLEVTCFTTHQHCFRFLRNMYFWILG